MHQPEQKQPPRFWFTVIGYGYDKECEQGRINMKSFYEMCKENAITRYYKEFGMDDGVVCLHTRDTVFDETVTGEEPVHG